MSFSDLTLLSKIAIGLALAGFVVSFSTLNTTSINGVSTCDYLDYGKVLFGGLAVVVGGMGEFAALRLDRTRVANLAASGGATVVGIYHLLVGMGIVGGPC